MYCSPALNPSLTRTEFYLKDKLCKTAFVLFCSQPCASVFNKAGMEWQITLFIIHVVMCISV